MIYFDYEAHGWANETQWKLDLFPPHLETFKFKIIQTKKIRFSIKKLGNEYNVV